MVLIFTATCVAACVFYSAIINRIAYTISPKLSTLYYRYLTKVLANRVFSALNSDMPFEEMIENWINAYYELLPEYPQIPMFILNEISHSPEALVKKILKKNPQRIFSRFSDRMEDEIRKGT
ncbi:MAG TPA: hypothetical protein PKO22_05405, partial [Treponemataceae bacterium]|nr:hypothetical protein [Treponemataceae bacterium]